MVWIGLSPGDKRLGDNSLASRRYRLCPFMSKSHVRILSSPTSTWDGLVLPASRRKISGERLGSGPCLDDKTFDDSLLFIQLLFTLTTKPSRSLIVAWRHLLGFVNNYDLWCSRSRMWRMTHAYDHSTNSELREFSLFSFLAYLGLK